MKNRYWLLNKDGAYGSLMANYDIEHIIKEYPEYYEVSAFWYYASKLWRLLAPHEVDRLIIRVKSWWLSKISRL